MFSLVKVSKSKMFVDKMLEEKRANDTRIQELYGNN